METYAEVLEHVNEGWFSWHKRCRTSSGALIFQYLNVEFVEALAQYLRGKGRVLEVGAGDGWLAQALRNRGVSIIATDDGSMRIKPVTPVECLDYRKAIQKFQPDLILCSWMPLREDWTPSFREAVDEYVLIGEDGGCCGTPEAWRPSSGWTAENLKDVTRWSIGRSDSPWGVGFSHVISFRRTEEKAG